MKLFFNASRSAPCALRVVGGLMSDKVKERIVKVSLVQQGPAIEDKEKNIEELLKTVDEIGEKERPDFVLLGELSTIPYIGAVLDPEFYGWAETIPGPTTEAFSEKAKKYEMCVLVGIFEKATPEGIYYNSLVVLGPEGKLIEGIFPDGTRTLRYAKSHIPYSVRNLTKYNETFYFTPGSGWPIFNTPKAKIGLTICYDRHFPEPFRLLALQGAEIIFNPSVAMGVVAIGDGASMADVYLTELRAHAVANSTWVCAVNKAGTETLRGQETHCYGNSAIIDPTGKIRAQGPTEKAAVVSYDLDLEDVATTQHIYRYIKARRPHLYKLMAKEDYSNSDKQ